MKKSLIISLCLLTLFTVGCGCNNKKDKNKEEDKLGFDVNFNITDDQEVNGLKMTDTSLIIEKGISTFQTLVTNNSGDVYKLKSIDIVFKNKDGNTIQTLSGYIGDSLEKDGTQTLNVVTDRDLTSATKIEYKINK